MWGELETLRGSLICSFGPDCECGRRLHELRKVFWRKYYLSLFPSSFSSSLLDYLCFTVRLHVCALSPAESICLPRMSPRQSPTCQCRLLFKGQKFLPASTLNQSPRAKWTSQRKTPPSRSVTRSTVAQFNPPTTILIANSSPATFN